MSQRRHRRYWEKRNDQILRWLENEELDIYKAYQDAYAEALHKIRKDLHAFFDKYAEENKITRKEAMKRLRREDLSDYHLNARLFRENAENLEPEQREALLKRLNEQYRSSKVTRADALELDLLNELAQLNTNLQSIMFPYLLKVADYAYLNAMPQDFTTSTLNRYALEEVVRRPCNGFNYSENIWGNTDNLADKVKDIFKNGFTRGSSVQEMSSELKKVFRVKQSDAETLIRTDGSHIVNNASLKRYIDAGVERVSIHVHLDHRTSDICRGIHQTVQKVESWHINDPKLPKLPAHFNCRSTYIPVISTDPAA